MTIQLDAYSQFLEGVAEDIDIPPSKYQDAVERYRAVGRWLEDGEYSESSGPPDIYPQGSFRLGTVVKPVEAGAETDYDIDLVCELCLDKAQTTPDSVKAMVGDRLKEHETYRRLLDDESKRCWTLEYAEQDGLGFHLDVLPAVPDPNGPGDQSIAITDRSAGHYKWSASNPRGYARWFDEQNRSAFQIASPAQKLSIQARHPEVYANVDEVPDQLVRTPLQRAIQLMKRHRDMRFSDPTSSKYAPISIIITTLAATLYRNEPNVYAALKGIVEKLDRLSGLLSSQTAQLGEDLDVIRRTADGGWYIGNPVNPEENFADRWHEDNHARAKAFFSWTAALKEDLVSLLDVNQPAAFEERLTKALGESAVKKHLSLLGLPTIKERAAPRIAISDPPKPWRSW